MIPAEKIALLFAGLAVLIMVIAAVQGIDIASPFTNR